MIAEIIIQSNVKNLNRTFDYEIPREMEETIKIGSRVLVPFGRMKQLEEGFVIALKEYSEYEVKKISKIEKNQVLDEEKIELAKWMAKRYFCNISDCLRLMVPPGTTTKNFSNRVKEKNINFITLKKEVDEIETDIEIGKIKNDRQIRTLRFIMENGDMTVSDLEMFADTTRAVINTLCKNGYLEAIEKQIERDPFENKQIERSSKLKLNQEQQHAFDVINESMEDMLFSEFLIFGVTGSRKNRNLFTINRKGIKGE